MHDNLKSPNYDKQVASLYTNWVRHARFLAIIVQPNYNNQVRPAYKVEKIKDRDAYGTKTAL